jgi:hypothetical protein
MSPNYANPYHPISSLAANTAISVYDTNLYLITITPAVVGDGYLTYVCNTTGSVTFRFEVDVIGTSCCHAVMLPAVYQLCHCDHAFRIVYIHIGVGGKSLPSLVIIPESTSTSLITPSPTSTPGEQLFPFNEWQCTTSTQLYYILSFRPPTS